MNHPLLQVSDLAVEFHDGLQATRAVDGVSFVLPPGGTLGLVGESGCGKSTVALALLGLLPPNGRVVAGTACFRGQDLLSMPPGDLRRLRGDRIAMVFQDPMTCLNPYQPIGVQVGEPLRVHRRLGRGEARRRAGLLLEAVGIPPAGALDRYPHEFSGGQRQRIMIAMALACDPDLLVADEPTTALDVTVQAQVLDLLAAEQARRGMALILVSHNLGVVVRACQRTAVMYAGRVVETAPTAQLFTTPHHPYTRGLLAAIPTLDGPPRQALATIPGLPPRLAGPWPGCAFAPRCPFAQAGCAACCPDWQSPHPDHHHRCPVTPAGHGFPADEPVIGLV